MPLNPGEASAPLPTIEPTFVSIRDNVFSPHCVKCHGQGADHDDIDIFNLDTLTGPKGWVVPSDPDKSELYQDLIKTGKGRMPPLKTGPGLPADQIDVIRTWILNGAKD
jgi:mono/diheme cytochrome c family protein